MIIDNLRMRPFNATLMGVLRGVVDYYGIAMSDAMLFGGSGHAFVMNIHETLCPSGPYCWNRDPFYRVVRNLGIEMRDEGFFWKETPTAERTRIEALLRESLDHGVPCSLVNMEYQLITGYDDTGFLTVQPWAPKVDFPPAHLTFGSWAEMGDEVHVNFFTHPRCDAAGEHALIAASLAYAVDLYRNPTAHSEAPYSVGAGAYARWINAVRNGHGAEHGAWWNGTVWAECRQQASAYLAESAPRLPGQYEIATRLSAAYAQIAGALLQVSDRALDSMAKVALLEQAAAIESAAIEQIEQLMVGMLSPVAA